MEEKTNQSQGKEEKKGSEVIKMVLKYVVGIILVVVGLILIWVWRQSFLTVFKGCFGPLLILIGAIIIAIAKE